MELIRDFDFEAAHFLPNVPRAHKCRRLHGHHYRVRVCVRGKVGRRSGWVIDFAEIDAAVDPWIRRFDHHCLNDLAGLKNPTAENLALLLWRKLAPELPGLARVEAWENAWSGAACTGDDE